MSNLIVIAFFGLAGVLFRYGIDQHFTVWNYNIPTTTILINILASLIAGTIYAFSVFRSIPTTLQTGLLVGFCGGFSTFSAYTLQTFTLLERGKFVLAFSYFIISPALGLLAAFLPFFFARKFFS